MRISDEIDTKIMTIIYSFEETIFKLGLLKGPLHAEVFGDKLVYYWDDQHKKNKGQKRVL